MARILAEAVADTVADTVAQITTQTTTINTKTTKITPKLHTAAPPVGVTKTPGTNKRSQPLWTKMTTIIFKKKKKNI